MEAEPCIELMYEENKHKKKRSLVQRSFGYFYDTCLGFSFPKYSVRDSELKQQNLKLQNNLIMHACIHLTSSPLLI